MKLAEAIACVDRGIAKAQSMGLKLSFAVIDEFGQLVQMDRMDGASLMGPDIAEAKALTALNFRCPTSEVAKVDREELKALAEAVHFPVVPVAGGVPIFEGAELKGAIGVSGASSQQDEEIARHAAGP
jgi:glc operon protein GlcG